MAAMAEARQVTAMNPGLAEESGGDPRELTPAERRLAASRAQLERLLEPGPDDFPRSQTMRFLMGGKGRIVTLGAFAGLLAVKPKLALTLVTFLPLGKLLPVARFIQTLR
jgi:hypothetical protein